MKVHELNMALDRVKDETRPIICDTMIWYYIARGEIDTKKLSGLHLVGTLTNVFELITTPNIRENEGDYLTHPLLSMLEHCEELRLVHHLEYAYRKFKPDFAPTNELLIESIKYWISQNTCPKLGLNSQAYQYWPNLREALQEDFAKGFETKLKFIRSSLKESRERKEYKWNQREWYDNAMEGFRLEMCEHLNVEVNGNDFPWKSIAAYLAARVHYEAKLNLDEKMKIDANDQRDIENLLYVNPNELYWTMEKRWHTALNNQGLSRYIFRR